MAEFPFNLTEEDIHQLMHKMRVKALPKEANPVTYVAQLGTLLTQDQVTGAVQRTLAGDVEPLSLESYDKETKTDLKGADITKAAPYWFNVSAYIREVLKLNNPTFWMDLLCQAGAKDTDFLPNTLQAFRKESIEEIANQFTRQNSKLYLKGFLHPELSALVGGELDFVQGRSRFHPPFEATETIRSQFEGLALNFNEFLQRLQSLYGVSRGENPTTKAHDFLVDNKGFVNDHYIPELKCPAIGLANMVSVGYSHELNREGYIEAFNLCSLKNYSQ